jgi:hypothetical protein
MGLRDEKIHVVVSESLIQEGSFGGYLVPELNPSLEYYLVGGCATVEEARTKTQEVIARSHSLKASLSQEHPIESRKRGPTKIDNTMKMMSEKELEDSICIHIAGWFEGFSWKKIPTLLLHQNAIFLLVCFAIWLFWTDGSIIVPEKLYLPIVGDRLGGKGVDAKTLASCLPVALLALYTVRFALMVKTNLENDSVRKEVIAAVFQHGWRVLDFAKLIQPQMVKKGLKWFVNAVDGLHDMNPASLANLRKSAAIPQDKAKGSMQDGKEGVSEKIREELDQKLAQWLSTEFDRRIHNLYYIDKEKDYNRFVISFDPLIYIISLNRVIYRMYDFLRQKGINVDSYNAPRDPYLIQRVAAPVFFAGEAFRVALLGGAIIWSYSITGFQLSFLFITNILAGILTIVVPTWWNYLAIIAKRGFPKAEPLGAYTVGPMAPNRLSVL